MYGMTDKWFTLLMNILGANNLALRADSDGMIVFSQEKDDNRYVYSKDSVGELIGKVLYGSDTGTFDINYSFSINELRLANPTMFEEAYQRYIEDIKSQFKSETHPISVEVNRILQEFTEITTIKFTSYSPNFFNEGVENKVWIPEELFVKQEDGTFKKYSPQELRGEDLKLWLEQRGVMERYDVEISSDDDEYGLGYDFYSTFLEYVNKGANLQLISEITLSLFMGGVQWEMKEAINTMAYFIEHCEDNSIYFDIWSGLPIE